MKKTFVMIGLAIVMIACQPAAPKPGADLIGNWTNPDTTQPIITRINIQPSGNSFLVEKWVECGMIDCYWQKVPITVQDVTATGMTFIFDFGYNIETLTLELLPDGSLSVTQSDSLSSIVTTDRLQRAP